MNPNFIPFADPHAAYQQRKAEILSAVERVFDSGAYILGSEVQAFEEEFAVWNGNPHVTGCANGIVDQAGMGAGSPGRWRTLCEY